MMAGDGKDVSNSANRMGSSQPAHARTYGTGKRSQGSPEQAFQHLPVELSIPPMNQNRRIGLTRPTTWCPNSDAR